MGVTRLRHSTLAQLVREQIEKNIFSGEFKIGQKINEVTLANEFGVSRGPIREACRHLEEGGWLESFPQRGSFVREVSLEEAKEVDDTRVVFGFSVGKLAAKRITDQEISELELLPQEMLIANDKASADEIYKVSHHFHMSIIKSTHNSTIVDLFQKLHLTHRLFRLRFLQVTDTMREDDFSINRSLIEDRVKIIEALKARNINRVGKLYEQYLKGCRERNIKRYIEFEKLHVPN
jgi:DNA-binding GntR family transcriptional regulator